LVTPPKPASIAGAIAVSVLGGAMCAWLGTPLPWVLGSMFAMAAAQMAGAGLEDPPGGREAGMLVVGVSLGLYFTAPVVAEVAAYWPWFVFLGFAAIGFGAASALVLMRMGGVDRATAYFGSMPGGASEMVTIGERHGARADQVALAHSLRLLVVITAVPISITLAGFSATEDYRPVTVAFDPLGLAILLGAAAMAGFVAKRLRTPTAFTMGPLLLVIAITLLGVQLSSVPSWLTNAAQVLLGCSLGARFDRTLLRDGAAPGRGHGPRDGPYARAGDPGGLAHLGDQRRVPRNGAAFRRARRDRGDVDHGQGAAHRRRVRDRGPRGALHDRGALHHPGLSPAGADADRESGMISLPSAGARPASTREDR
jgi:membrane AbrB-like protein